MQIIKDQVITKWFNLVINSFNFENYLCWKYFSWRAITKIIILTFKVPDLIIFKFFL